MRYISQHGNYVIYTNGGEAKYKFDPQGILDLGTGVTIDATLTTDPADTIARIYKTDLLGTNTCAVELAGQGSLDGLADGGSALSSLATGLRGQFFKAPFITPGSTTVEATQGVRYRVYADDVTYASVTYKAGEVFVADGTTTTTSGAGKFSLDIHPSVDEKYDEFRNENFKAKKLVTGDEYGGKWNFANGAPAKSSLVSTDPTYFGWVR